MPTKTDTAFDCIAFKTKVQEQIYEETKDMSNEQRVAYVRMKADTGPFAERWQRLLHRNNQAHRSKNAI